VGDTVVINDSGLKAFWKSGRQKAKSRSCCIK
jgi:hypothetical protein